MIQKPLGGITREVIADKKNQLILPRAKFLATEQREIGAAFSIGSNRFEQAPLWPVQKPWLVCIPSAGAAIRYRACGCLVWLA